MKFQAASQGAFACATCRWNVSLRHGQTLCKGQGHYFGKVSLIEGPVPMILFNVQVFEFSISSWPAKHLFRYFKFHQSFRDSFDSSVGRAEDCSWQIVILRSLVRIRLEGNFFFPMIFFFFRLENRSKLFSSHLYLTFLHVLLLFWSAFYRA